MDRKLITSLAALLLALAPAAGQNNVRDAVANAAQAISDAPEEKPEVKKPSNWTNSLMTNINFLQTGFSNWAKGGTNTFALSTYIDANAKYAKDDFYWNNRLQLDYGLLYSQDKPILQKNKDRILLESTAAYKATKTLSYSAKFTFLNQFSRGYTYATPTADNPSKQDWKDAKVLKSAGFSPAIFTLGLGIDWIPTNWLKVNFAPLTGGCTVVSEEALRKKYGMNLKKGHDSEEAVADANGLLTNGDIYRAARFDLGAQLSLDAQVKINDNFEAATQLILFSNYLHNPLNLRTNWDNRFMWKVAKYFSLNLTTNLIYDDTVLITDEDHPEGRKAIQFYEALQFGFTYTFATKK